MAGDELPHNIASAFADGANVFRETGFPKSYILTYLSEEMNTIYRSLGLTQPDLKKTSISFNPDEIEYRQQIVKVIQAKRGLSSDGRIYNYFKKGLNDETVADLLRKLGRLKSEVPYQNSVDAKYFEKLCVGLTDLYKLSGDFLNDLDELSSDPTYRILKGRVAGVKRQFGSLINIIDSVDKINLFQVDTKMGTIIPVLEEAKITGQKIHVENAVSSFESQVDPKRITRKAITDLHFNMIRELRRELLNSVRDEMYIERRRSESKLGDRPPMFAIFRDLARPIILFEAYKNYINSYKLEPKDDEDDIDGRGDLSSLKFVYPEFSNRFNVKQLFPLAFSPKYDLSGQEYVPLTDYVPIDFETHPNERKIALMGLNSGGKSVTLENLVLSEFIGSMGLPLPATEVTLPRCKRLIYYNNSRRGAKGKLETEMNDVAKIINHAEKEDLIVIDNFFEGGTPQITIDIADMYMEALTDTDARILLESHAPLDLNHFECLGWTTFVPEYEIKRRKIKPTYKLKRGRPDLKIMKRYATEKAKKYLNAEGNNETDEEE